MKKWIIRSWSADIFMKIHSLSASMLAKQFHIDHFQYLIDTLQIMGYRINKLLRLEETSHAIGRARLLSDGCRDVINTCWSLELLSHFCRFSLVQHVASCVQQSASTQSCNVLMERREVLLWKRRRANVTVDWGHVTIRPFLETRTFSSKFISQKIKYTNEVVYRQGTDESWAT